MPTDRPRLCERTLSRSGAHPPHRPFARQVSVAMCLVAGATATLALHPRAALADDGVFGGIGTALMPVQETRVRMASEDIVLEQRGRARLWYVTAHYVFENPTDAEVALHMGFPEARCRDVGADNCLGGGEFRELSTTVRGVAVTTHVGRVSATARMGDVLGRVHLFDVTFAPRERVEILHRYNYHPSGSGGDQEVHFVTRTGAGWNGPIGSARFTVRTPYKPWAFQYARELQLVSHAERVVEGSGPVHEIVFENRDWTPRGDLQAVLVTTNSVFVGVNTSAVWIGSEMGLGPECPTFPSASGESDDEELGPEDVAALRLCRDALYALHGRSFGRRALDRRFYPIARHLRVTGQTDQITVLTLEPSATYSDALLTSDERRYIALIDRMLARSRAAARRNAAAQAAPSRSR